MTVCSTVNNCGSTIGGRRLADEASAPVRTGATRFVAGCAIRCGGQIRGQRRCLYGLSLRQRASANRQWIWAA